MTRAAHRQLAEEEETISSRPQGESRSIGDDVGEHRPRFLLGAEADFADDEREFAGFVGGGDGAVDFEGQIELGGLGEGSGEGIGELEVGVVFADGGSADGLAVGFDG